MPSILWGDDEGAAVCVPFNGYCSLSGCQLLGVPAADDDVALAFNAFTSDANTVGLWHMGEASWNGTAGEVIDSSANGYHGTAGGGANTELGAMSRYGQFNAANRRVQVPAADFEPAAFTFECWAYLASHMQYSRMAEHGGFGSANGWDIEGHSTSGRFDFKRWSGATPGGGSIPAVLPVGSWAHVAYMVNGAGSGRSAVNGVLGSSVSFSNLIPAATVELMLGCIRSNTLWATHYWHGNLDEIRISNVVRYSANFTPVWRKSAAQNGGVQPYVQVSGSGLAGMLPTAVSWTAQTGSAYGRIHSVWVNDVTSGWVQVGGAYPTSPVSVAGLTLASDDAVRVALEPEAVSGIQNASPTLQSLLLDWAAPSVSFVPRRITPVRLGPRLLPIGVIC